MFTWLIGFLSSMPTVVPTNPDADGLVGAIFDWPSDTLPGPKYLFADGSLFNIADYTLLYSRIGDQHNTGGETAGVTARLPNRVKKIGRGLTGSEEIGDTGGSDASNMPAHVHVVTGAPGGTFASSSHTHDQTDSGGPNNNTTVQSGTGVTVAANNHIHDLGTGLGPSSTASPTVGSLGTDSQGSGGVNDNWPSYQITRYIIKVR